MTNGQVATSQAAAQPQQQNQPQQQTNPQQSQTQQANQQGQQQNQTQQQSQQQQQTTITIPGTNIQIPTSLAAANGIISGNNIKLDGSGILNLFASVHNPNLALLWAIKTSYTLTNIVVNVEQILNL